MDETSPPPSGFSRFFGAVRGKVARKVLVFALFGMLGLLAWWFLGRMPAEGSVEVRWTESPPAWIAISYVDERGDTVRWRREDVRPGSGEFIDRYKLAPGKYWLHIDLRQGDRLRSVRKRVELPTDRPYVLYLEELDVPAPR
jgi:hypothetical protein